MSIDLTQSEADQLMAMPKRSSSEDACVFPFLGGKLVIELESVDKTEDFLLDVTRSRIDFSRITYQNRARIVVVLKRLDLNGAPHRNPDDEVVPCPHMHSYREGYGDKWAAPVLPGKFTNLADLPLTLDEFMAECNVVQAPDPEGTFLMLSDIEGLLDRYNLWLKDSNSLREVADWVEITTPYLDRHNDQPQIFARRENGHFVLSDDGYIIRDLESSGCNLGTQKRQELLKMTLNGSGSRRMMTSCW